MLCVSFRAERTAGRRLTRLNPGKDGKMPKYQILIAASGKHGSALLPYVLVDCKNAQNAARRAVSMARIAYPEYDKFEARKPEVISGE
jgi:hypothetical protein|nr:MAG TPA: hypothetical protein [Caudoviricetes sp.]